MTLLADVDHRQNRREDIAGWPPSPILAVAADTAESNSGSSRPNQRCSTAPSTYPGGKAQCGVYQRIINQIPPHDVYIELFLGAGAVLRNKRPAKASVAIDANAGVVELWRAGHYAAPPGCIIINGDAISFLRGYSGYTWTGHELVYLDPPYLFDVRSSGRRGMYAHEFGEEAQHLELLTLAKAIPARVMISGYYSDFYAQKLEGWRTIQYTAVTRAGTLAEEWLWMNYPEPVRLHDYSHLGENFRERERIKRKKARWTARLKSMPASERYALLSSLAELDGDGSSIKQED